MTTVAVLDYGSGNLHSVARAVARTGVQVVVTADPKTATEADGLVVPGVGAFAACLAGLISVGGDQVIRGRLAASRPILGICVGQQIMFTEGVEHGECSAGLGIWPGVVEPLRAAVLPHMGWNLVTPPSGSVLFDGISDQRFYFVHSYAARQAVGLTTWAEHGPDRFVAAVEDGPLTATQFHPEKSGAAGLQLLRNWVQIVKEY